MKTYVAVAYRTYDNKFIDASTHGYDTRKEARTALRRDMKYYPYLLSVRDAGFRVKTYLSSDFNTDEQGVDVDESDGGYGHE